MPVNVPAGLPAVDVLNDENIFVMTSLRAQTQDIRPLRIIILNLMPAKAATETQLLRMLSNSPLQVEVTLLRTESYQPRNTDAAHLGAFYHTFEEIKGEQFDGLVVTGAPIERMEFEEVAYWQELIELLDWAAENVYASLFICWGAQAALYHYYGIQKQMLGEKLFGVYPHQVVNRTHPLLRGFDDVFFAPHSRHSTVDLEAIGAHPALEALAVSDQAGLYLAASRDGRRVFVTGHGEYDPQTLLLEHERDQQAGMDTKPPVNYFLNGELSPFTVGWRAHGNLLYGNWLNYFVYQATPYHVEEVRAYRHMD